MEQDNDRDLKDLVKTGVEYFPPTPSSRLGSLKEKITRVLILRPFACLVGLLAANFCNEYRLLIEHTGNCQHPFESLPPTLSRNRAETSSASLPDDDFSDEDRLN